MYRVVSLKGEDKYGSTKVAATTLATARSTPPSMQLARGRPGRFSIRFNNIVAFVKQRYDLG